MRYLVGAGDDVVVGRGLALGEETGGADGDWVRSEVALSVICVETSLNRETMLYSRGARRTGVIDGCGWPRFASILCSVDFASLSATSADPPTS